MSEPAHEYFLEFVQHGRLVKVTAIDSISGREVSLVGDVNAGQKALGNLAIRKLQYVVARDLKKGRP